jgi:arginine decarboxylase
MTRISGGPSPLRRGLRIEVAAAIGHGATPLSSFDRALFAAGVHNYNLSLLSSVIPPASEVVSVDCCVRPPGEFGQRLWVVLAEERSTEPGVVLAAGIGWFQWGDGRGCFVEERFSARELSLEQAEAALRCRLTTALRDLCATRDVPFDESRVGARIAVCPVGGAATTALAVATYQSEGWR